MAEIAEDLGYEEIAFLDDKSSKAIGKIFVFEFTIAFGSTTVPIPIIAERLTKALG